MDGHTNVRVILGGIGVSYYVTYNHLVDEDEAPTIDRYRGVHDLPTDHLNCRAVLP